MLSSILAAAAVLVTVVVADTPGSAIVKNACSYDVYLYNTPAADGGYSQIVETLPAYTGEYEQTWTELTNGDGWSIKLSQIDGNLNSIMQYEYTWHNDGIIWYDLSDVNGNPWDGNWEITASSPDNNCAPKQQAYRYSTDDAYGMQACPDAATITVTLCSGDSSDDASASAVSVSVASVSSVASTATTAATSTFTTPTTTPTPTTTTASTKPTTTKDTKTTVVTTPTTFATVTSATTTDESGSTVTTVDTSVVTAVVTQTYYTGGNHWHTRRHEHAHAHGRL